MECKKCGALIPEAVFIVLNAVPVSMVKSLAKNAERWLTKILCFVPIAA